MYTARAIGKIQQLFFSLIELGHLIIVFEFGRRRCLLIFGHLSENNIILSFKESSKRPFGLFIIYAMTNQQKINEKGVIIEKTKNCFIGNSKLE